MTGRVEAGPLPPTNSSFDGCIRAESDCYYQKGQQNGRRGADDPKRQRKRKIVAQTEAVSMRGRGKQHGERGEDGARPPPTEFATKPWRQRRGAAYRGRTSKYARGRCL